MKNKKHNNLIEEFSLSQYEVHEYGKFLLERIFDEYDGLILDPDHCWELERNLKQMEKLVTMVVRLQDNKKLRETKNEI